MSEVGLFGGGSTAVGHMGAIGSAPMGRTVARSTKKSIDLVVGHGEVANTIDVVRAGLTGSALNNVGTLVSTATQLMNIAPEGQVFYEAIVSAYAMGAANQIARFNG